MAKASGLSVSCVHRIWRAFSLQPHRSGSFRLSADSPFVVRQTATPACPLHADLGVRSTRSNGSSRWYRSADRRGAHRSTKAVEAAISDFIDARNAYPKAVLADQGRRRYPRQHCFILSAHTPR